MSSPAGFCVFLYSIARSPLFRFFSVIYFCLITELLEFYIIAAMFFYKFFSMVSFFWIISGKCLRLI